MKKSSFLTKSESDNIRDYISGLISKKKSNIELELRINDISLDKLSNKSGISQERFEKILSALKKSEKTTPEINKSLVMIENNLLDLNVNSRIVYLIKDKKITEKYKEIKKNIKNTFLNRLGIKLSIAEETKITSEVNQLFKLARFRERITFTFNEWQIDLTQIYEKSLTDNDFAELKTWVGSIENLKPDSYECEIECISNKTDIDEIYTDLLSVLNKIKLPEYLADFDFLCEKNDIFSKVFPILGIEENPDSGVKNIIQEVMTFSGNNLGYISGNEYYITEKADGDRNLLYISSEKSLFLINNHGGCCKITDNFNVNSEYLPVLFDGEIVNILSDTTSLDEIKSAINSAITSDNFVIETDQKTIKKTYLIFDVLIFAGKNITHYNLTNRIATIEKIDTKNSYQYVCDKSNFELSISQKGYHPANVTNVNLLINKKFQYHIDGIIFTPNEGGYYNKNIFKYKPVEFNSIDFLMRIIDDNVQTKIIRVYFYVGISKKFLAKNNLSHEPNFEKLFGTKFNNAEYIPIEFRTRDNSRLFNCTLDYSKKYVENGIVKYKLKHGGCEIYDDSIVECVYTRKIGISDLNKWLVIRFRTDKTVNYKSGQKIFGNNFMVALNNWLSIKNPVDLTKIKYFSGSDEVKKTDANQYYAESKTERDNIKIFHNYIKGLLYKKYAFGANYLLELGGGRANDLNKWCLNKIKNVVLVDLSQDALDQGKIRYEKYNRIGLHKPKITFLQGDLSKDLISKILKKDFFNTKLRSLFDVITAQFSFHYFYNDTNDIKRIVNEIYLALKVDGYFILTGFDGNKIFNLLQDKSQDYTYSVRVSNSDENSDVLFSIKKLYSSNVLNKAGQSIEVYIKSIGIPHTENLINFEYLKEVFTENNHFSIEADVSFEELYPGFEKNRELVLSPSEKNFSFLNRYLVLKKNYIKNLNTKSSKKKFIERDTEE